MYTNNKFGMYNSWPDKRYLLLTLQFILLLTLFVINTLASSNFVVQLVSIERGKYSFLAFKCMNFFMGFNFTSTVWILYGRKGANKMIIYLVSYIQQPKNKDAFFIYGRFRSYKKCKIVYKQLYMAENGHIKGGSNLIWPFFKQNCGVQNHYMAVLNIKLGVWN